MWVMPELPFAVDGSVSAEKLAELLAVGTEYAELDFKRELNLAKGQDKHRVDFASDVAALSSLPQGGYIVVGADDRGQLAGAEFAPPDPGQYDEATLRQIVSRYVEGPVRLVVGLHAVDGRQLAVVYVGPSADALPPVMRCDGSYLLPGGDFKIVFRAGDIYVRDGTSSVRMQHKSWPLLLANFRSRVRAEAAHDTQDVVGRLAELLRGGMDTPAVIDIAMGPADFERAVAAALSAGDVAAVRRALRQTGPVRRRWTDPGRNEEIETALDRMVAVAAVAVQHENHECFDLAVGLMLELYTVALSSPTETFARPGHERQAAWLWRSVAARVLALLAMIVRFHAWPFVPDLVLRRIGPGGDASTYHSWMRHAVTEASRQNLLLQQDGVPADGALLSFAREVVRRVPVLWFDLAAEEVERQALLPPDGERDDLLDSLCQADFLWCLVVVTKCHGARRPFGHEFYPSCSAFSAVRTQPLVDKIVTSVPTRYELFGSGTDYQVGPAIADVDATAARQQARYSWTIRTPRVNEWIADYTF